MEKAIQDFKSGKPVIVLDDVDRENEADLILAAEFATPEIINQFIRNGTGILCVPMTEARAIQLGLTQMVTNNTDPNRTNYTISCDSVDCSTGVSALDRTKTILTLADSKLDKKSIRTPGHIFPLVCKPGLLNQRRGHTEASIQLCLIADLKPVSVIVELMNPDGTMCRASDISKLSYFNDVPVVTIDQIINYNNSYSIEIPVLSHIECNLTVNLDQVTHFKVILYRNEYTKEEVCMLKVGQIVDTTYLRIHSECFTGNVLHSLHCDCDQQLFESLKLITQSNGILFYMIGHEGRGIGLFDKLRTYKLQDEQKLDTIEANLTLNLPIDNRNYQMAIRIMQELNIKKVKLITNNPEKYKLVSQYFETEMVNLKSTVNSYNQKYLETKKNKMGHI